MKIVVISGGFDPIHKGHLDYINSASKLGDKLVILLNSDDWLKAKKGKEFLSFKERKSILEAIKKVDAVYGFKDDKFGSCSLGLEKLKRKYPNDQILFCNGGDRNKNNIPELEVKNIEFKFSIGGNKKRNSSSKILNEWKNSLVKRRWGTYSNLLCNSSTKVKELVVEPGKGMSYQRHFHRSEIWFISSGSCIVHTATENPNNKKTLKLNKFDSIEVAKNSWHQITNPYKKECRIIEIQFGEKVEEDDIERLYYFEPKK